MKSQSTSAILNDVSYPPAYARFVAPFQIVGLDVPALLPLSCLTAGTFDYFASLRLMTLGPLVVVAAYGVLFCVEINHWFGGSPPNFRTLYLDQIEVDSADFWTDRLLSSSSRSTAESLASKRSHTRTLKSG